jgi:hypothetical protein
MVGLVVQEAAQVGTVVVVAQVYLGLLAQALQAKAITAAL